MAKKAPAKPAAKRKPRAKKPVQPAAVEPSERNTAKPSSTLRRFLSSGAAAAMLAGYTVGVVWLCGGVQIGPEPLPSDAVSVVFDAQESAFRSLSGERAKALRAGEIKSEAASVEWMSSRFLPKAEAAWTPLLTAEKAAFGGEQWTAEKEASHIEEYAR